MYVKMDENHRNTYLGSLEAKAVTKEMSKRGLLAGVFVALSMLMFVFTSTPLMTPGENDAWSYIVPGASLVLFICALIYSFIASKKSRASTVTVADQLREVHGGDMLEEIKQQVTAGSTLVFSKKASQKKDFCYLTDKWLVFGKEFVRLDDIAQATIETQRVAKYSYIANLCLVLESTGAAVSLPIDYSSKGMNELIDLICQKNPYTLTNKITKELKKEAKKQGEKLKVRSNEDVIELYRQRKGQRQLTSI